MGSVWELDPHLLKCPILKFKSSLMIILSWDMELNGNQFKLGH